MNQTDTNTLQRYLSPLGAWALAFGCAVGWGAFAMPGNTFLPLAGPGGTALGILIGGVLLLLIAANYHFLMGQYPDAGGALTYTKRIFGYDHGFLCAWFLVLTYVAIIWANATALTLIGRNIFGDLFQFGWHYQLAGFDVYLGEVMVSILALAVCGAICLRNAVAKGVQIIMALVLIIGIIVCFIACWTGHEGGTQSLGPAFAPDEPPVKSVIIIVFLAPWAFIGFESISHSAGEFNFPVKKAGRIMALALLTAAVAYALLAICAVTALPEGFKSWPDYIANLGNLKGVEGLPTFFATESVMGKTGVLLLAVTTLGGIITGLVGNCIASSRLLYSMAEDELLPPWFGKLSRGHTPKNAILFIMLVSMIIPFFGRTATGWIVDVTTVGAAMVYAYVSAAALRSAQKSGDRMYVLTGGAGVVVAMAFLLYFLIPNIMSVTTLATASYLILAAWSILGFLVFRAIFKHDRERRFGRSTIVWIVLLALIYFTSSVWLNQATDLATEHAIEPIHQYYSEQFSAQGIQQNPSDSANSYEFLYGILDEIHDSTTMNLLIQTAFIVMALLILFNVYSMLMKREKQAVAEKTLAEESSRAKTSFLSNMSHEIRTPMNAIIGLDNIALKDPDLPPRTREQLEKIGASANHLLGLINDILDMSRIESGRMVLKNEEFVFKDFLNQVNVIINGQCQDKGLNFECNIIGHADDYYVGDDMKLKQVLINILGNSVKFTEPPGTITFNVEQVERAEGRCTLRFTMKDTGIGMDEEYIPKIFEAFTQEDATTTNRYGGSGLGMAITKNFVEMMDGRIDVESKKGVGSTFTVTVSLGESQRVVEKEDLSHLPEEPGGEEESYDLEGLHLLIAEDIDLNAEILTDILEMEDMSAERAENGQIAVDMFRASDPGHFDAILMDIRMPVMDGLAAAGAIRALDRADAQSIPIIAMTANAFDEDVQNSLDAGMNEHLSKPVDPDRLYETLGKMKQGR